MHLTAYQCVQHFLRQVLKTPSRVEIPNGINGACIIRRRGRGWQQCWDFLLSRSHDVVKGNVKRSSKDNLRPGQRRSGKGESLRKAKIKHLMVSVASYRVRVRAHSLDERSIRVEVVNLRIYVVVQISSLVVYSANSTFVFNNLNPHIHKIGFRSTPFAASSPNPSKLLVG